MSELQKTWIVLINKTPRGPLTEDEVKALLQQRLIRTNDLAYLYESASAKASWKFLWQFPEFDRRLNETPPPKAVLEKRTATPGEEALPQAISEKVPEEFLDITPEELVLKAGGSRVINLSTPSLEDAAEEASEESSTSSFNRRPAALAFGTLAISLIVYFYSGQSARNPASDEAKKPLPGAIPTTSWMPKAPVPKNLSGKSVALPLDNRPKTVLPSPQAPAAQVRKPMPPPGSDQQEEFVPEVKDKGEISYEEYRRKRDEQRDRDMQDSERRYEDGEDEDSEEGTLEIRKPRIKKRKPKSLEEDEQPEESEEELLEE